MKKMCVLSVVTISALLVVVPVFSGEGAGGELRGDGQEVKKDECLLLAKNCANETETIQERIERLHNEIRKGADVYTPEELNVLDRQLTDEYKYLYDLTKGGDGHRPSTRRH